VAYNNLAWIYATDDILKDMALAEALATKAAALAAADTAAGAAVRDTLAWIYYQTERSDEALRHAQEAVAGMPGSAEARYHLGMIYLKRNLRASAVRELSRALELDPELPQKGEVLAVLDRIRRGKR
jgi:tetratricopeptide (TPR) repeat protein